MVEPVETTACVWGYEIRRGVEAVHRLANFAAKKAPLTFYFLPSTSYFLPSSTTPAYGHPFYIEGELLLRPSSLPPLALHPLPEHLWKVHVLQCGGFSEERGYLGGCVARDAAPDSSDQESEFGMGFGTGNEVLHRFLQ